MDAINMTTPIIALLILNILLGIMGSFVIWNRSAFLSDGLSHGGLLGVAFSFLTGINLTLSLMIFSSIFIFSIILLRTKSSTNTTIGIISYGCLAVAILIQDIYSLDLDLEEFLLGDIVNVTWQQIMLILIVAILITGFIYSNYYKLVLSSINREMAWAYGVKVEKLEMIFYLLLGVVITLLMNMVGVLLASAMLLMPPASAALFSSSPIRMIMLSIFVGIFGSICGYVYYSAGNTPFGATIVTANFAVFIISHVISSLLNKYNSGRN